MIEVPLESVEVFAVIHWLTLARFLSSYGIFQILVEGYLTVSERNVVIQVDLVKLLVLGVEVVLLDQVIQFEGGFLDIAPQGSQLSLFIG